MYTKVIGLFQNKLSDIVTKHSKQMDNL